MYCGKCGAQQADDAVFCSECGAKLQSAPQQQPAQQIADINTPAGSPAGATVGNVVPSASNKNRMIGIIAVAVVVVILVVLGFLIFGGRSYKSTVKQFVEATFEADAKTMMKLFPEDYIKTTLKEEDFDSKKDMQEQLQKTLESSMEYINEQFDDWDYSYEISKTKDFSKDDLNDLKDELNDEYGIKVKDAKEVTVDVTVKAGGEKQNNDQEITVIKVGRSWYLWLE